MRDEGEGVAQAGRRLRYVEMEAAALLAVVRFRGVALGQLLYAGDSLAGESREHRDWVHAHDVRESLFWLAMDVAAELPGAF